MPVTKVYISDPTWQKLINPNSTPTASDAYRVVDLPSASRSDILAALTTAGFFPATPAGNVLAQDVGDPNRWTVRAADGSEVAHVIVFS